MILATATPPFENGVLLRQLEDADHLDCSQMGSSSDDESYPHGHFSNT